ncbi:MAG: hypothetical protein H6681_05950 [Desulfobacteraceae bacterium]|nr:hypothetical protein [Desulfobacteraceae bacterium]MCB9494967.1 hypothetical protein [Desulfobacteraceae bacterium]
MISELIKKILVICIIIFASSYIYAMDHEKEIEENYILSDKLDSLVKEIREKEKKYIETIKNLKIKQYLLSKKKEGLSSLEELKTEYIEKKIEEWKEILEELEKFKNEMPDFVKKEFQIKKEKLLKFFEDKSDFIAKAEEFKNFLRDEIDKTLNPYFKKDLFDINGEKKDGKALIIENNIVIIETDNDFYLWNKEMKKYETIENKSLKEVFSKENLDKNDFKPVFTDFKNEKI